MGGAGKWIKKNPAAALGLLAVGTGGLGAAGIGPLAFLAGGGTAAGAGVGAADALGAAGVLGGTAEGGGGALAGFSGLGGANAAAPLGLLVNEAPKYAALNAGAFSPTAPAAGGFDKYAKLGQMGLQMMQQDEPQMQQPQPLQLRGPGPQLQQQPLYGGGQSDPEEERRKILLALLMQQDSRGA